MPVLAFSRAPTTEDSPPVDEEAMRRRLLDRFNGFWIEAEADGTPYDSIATMAVAAAVYALHARHGTGTTATYLEGLAASLRKGEFVLR